MVTGGCTLSIEIDFKTCTRMKGEGRIRWDGSGGMQNGKGFMYLEE